MDNQKSNFSVPGKKPPQAIEAERSLIGGLMLDKSAITKIADTIRSEDFYKEAHQRIYQAIIELFEKGEPIDILTVSRRLQDKKEMERIGGNTYLTELVNSVPTAAHVGQYGKIIRQKKILRDLISASYDIGNLGYNEAQDIDVLLDRAEERIFSITQHSLTQDFIPVKSTLAEAFERIDALSKQGGLPRGVPTGFRDLDNKLAGLQGSDLIILAARPAMGKSALAVNIASSIAINQNIPVGIFSLEMGKDQIVDRLIASIAGIDLWRLRTGRLSGDGPDNDFDRIQRAIGILSDAPIFIDDTARTTVLQMRAMARRLQARHGLGLIVIDYLQLITPRNANDSTVRQVSEISRSLKILARELKVPVLALCQLSRAIEHRGLNAKPILADLRDSGSLEQDSDIVMFIYRKRSEASKIYENNAKVIIAKHRNGPVGTVDLYFDDARVSFRTVEKQLEEE